MDSPIFNFVKNYSKDIYPFHMPGHKRNADFLPPEIMQMDMTEIPGADNLHHAEGIIWKFQGNLAKTFGAEESYFLVNGSSGGIIAAVLSACGDGDEILIGRNSHRSVYSALVLSGAMPRYIMPEMVQDAFAGGMLPEKVAAALKQNSNIKAVFITSPTYEGFVSDIRSIAEICHSRGKVLIVDEAHGPHFIFSDAFPDTALQGGADIVIQSLHKTLPMLTQASVLHVQGRLADRARLRKYLSFMQTSSPSYVLMAQADYALAKIVNNADIFVRYVAKLRALREQLSYYKAIALVGEELKGKYAVYDVDISKIVLFVNSPDMTGHDLEERLRNRFGVQMEMSGLNHVIAMTSCADIQLGYDRLLQGVCQTNSGLTSYMEKQHNVITEPFVSVSPRKAMGAAVKNVALAHSVGCVAAEFAIPYPPGIPLISPGEKITREALDQLYLCLQNKIHITGLENIHTINVLADEGDTNV